MIRFIEGAIGELVLFTAIVVASFAPGYVLVFGAVDGPNDALGLGVLVTSWGGFAAGRLTAWLDGKR